MLAIHQVPVMSDQQRRSIYDVYIDDAINPKQCGPASQAEIECLRRILEPISGLMGRLGERGFALPTEIDLRNNERVERRWRLSPDRTLVVCALLPIIQPSRDPAILFTAAQARIVAGVSDNQDRFVEVGACGWYAEPVKSDGTLNIENHRFILAAVAGLVVRYQSGSRS
jgi:hypothetical protein